MAIRFTIGSVGLLLMGCIRSLEPGLRAEDLDHPRHGQLSMPKASKQNPLSVSRVSIEQGHDLYLRYCEGCHGAEADGGGHDAPLMRIKPPNLLIILPQRSDFELFQQMSLGGLAMPQERSHLSENDRWAVVNYLRSISGKK